MISPATTEELWSITRTAQYLGVPVGTLYQWRHRRIGPPASKVGRHLRYDPAAVYAWVRKRTT
jgi:excisionase family DNA binding protein